MELFEVQSIQVLTWGLQVSVHVAQRWHVGQEGAGFDRRVAPTRGGQFKQMMTRVFNAHNDVFGSWDDAFVSLSFFSLL